MVDEADKHLADPTTRTTEVLSREIASLKELLYSRIEAIENAVKVAHDDLVRVPTETQKAVASLQLLLETRITGNRQECTNQFRAADQASVLIRAVIETRLDGMDKAITLLQDTADKFPARIDEKITSLQEVHEGKFQSIQTQFVERDVRTDQTSRDSKVAVDAALQAAKEAVAEQNRSSALAIAKSEASTMKQIDQQGLLIQTTAKASDEKIDDIKERLTRIEGMGVGAITAQTTQQTSSGHTVNILALIAAVVLGVAGVVVAIVLRG